MIQEQYMSVALLNFGKLGKFFGPDITNVKLTVNYTTTSFRDKSLRIS